MSSTTHRGNSFDYTTNRHEITVYYIKYTTKSNELFSPNQQCNYAGLVKIHLLVQKTVQEKATRMPTESTPKPICKLPLSDVRDKICKNLPPISVSSLNYLWRPFFSLSLSLAPDLELKHTNRVIWHCKFLGKNVESIS